MKITYLGQSCIHIETKGKKLLFDPFIQGNPLAKNIDIKNIQADYILISHGHSDHTADVETIAKNTGATIISSYEITTRAQNLGVKKTHPMNVGGKWEFDFGTVLCVNAIHSSSFPDGSYAGPTMGFVIRNNEGCVYFAGDTALTMDMKLLPILCPPIDTAILPIGGNFTMDVEQAIIASDFTQCGHVIGCHYDTFGYIQIDHDKAQKDFKDKGKELLLLPIGESYITK